MGKEKMQMIEKVLIVSHVPWVGSRELYLPVNDLADDVFAYGALRKRKSHFTFEDLALFHSRGWAIKYIGKKSNRLHILGAEHLGEDLQ